jgi:FtsH-binding integral membrane protein
MAQTISYGASSAESKTTYVARFMAAVYAWVAVGLGITAAVAWKVAANKALFKAIFSDPKVSLGIFAVQVVLLLIAENMQARMNALTAFLLYLVYSIIAGFPIAYIFVVYKQQSLYQVIGLVTIAFFALSIFGATTRMNLSGLATFCAMAAIGLAIYGVAAVFVPGLATNQMTQIYCGIGLLIFSGLAAANSQTIRHNAEICYSHPQHGLKIQIIGALALYLSFKNMVLTLLELVGEKRD